MADLPLFAVRCQRCGQSLEYTSATGTVSVTPCEICAGPEKPDTPKNETDFLTRIRQRDARAWQELIEWPLSEWKEHVDQPFECTKEAVETAISLATVWGGGQDVFGAQGSVRPAPTGASAIFGGIEIYRDGWSLSERIRIGRKGGKPEHSVMLPRLKDENWVLFKASPGKTTQNP